MPPVIAFFLGTNNDWGGASRALLNFVRKLDRKAFTPLVVIPKPGPIQRILAAQGIPCEVWPIHDRSRNVLAYAIGVIRSMVFLRSHRIALAHLNYGAIGWKPAEILAARLLRIPLVNHFHNAVKTASSYLRYSTAAVGVSRFICEHSDHRGIPCHVVHNVADFDRFGNGRSKKKELGFKEDDIVISFFGQVRRIKGVLLFLDLAGRIPENDVGFLIAGELKGDDTFAPEEFKRMLAGDPRIKYLGYREDVEDLYASSDIVVMPSQWEEPCAMVLFEASAAGKPIVATATGGTPEIIVDGVTGYLVQRNDVEGLEARVRELLRDKQLRTSVGEQARQKAASAFTDAPVRQLEKLYQQLLVSKAKP